MFHIFEGYVSINLQISISRINKSEHTWKSCIHSTLIFSVLKIRYNCIACYLSLRDQSTCTEYPEIKVSSSTISNLFKFFVPYWSESAEDELILELDDDLELVFLPFLVCLCNESDNKSLLSLLEYFLRFLSGGERSLLERCLLLSLDDRFRFFPRSLLLERLDVFPIN